MRRIKSDNIKSNEAKKKVGLRFAGNGERVEAVGAVDGRAVVVHVLCVHDAARVDPHRSCLGSVVDRPQDVLPVVPVVLDLDGVRRVPVNHHVSFVDIHGLVHRVLHRLDWDAGE